LFANMFGAFHAAYICVGVTPRTCGSAFPADHPVGQLVPRNGDLELHDAV
jgi:hypothetical protein